jgi:DNA-binding NtrC family response regulator
LVGYVGVFLPNTWYEELLRKFRPVPPVRPLLLCVEDDSTYLSLRKAFLEQSGYNVIGATTAGEALKVLREAPVCATITDHFLHGTTGAQLAKEMKTIKPDVPIILYSGTAPDRLLGADVFINKSESVQTFLRIVGEVVERYRS